MLKRFKKLIDIYACKEITMEDLQSIQTVEHLLQFLDDEYKVLIKVNP